MIRADTEADKIYDRMRTDFGEASPKASGYLSDYSFRREREMVLEAVGDEPGTVVDLACGAGLITRSLVEAGRRVIGLDFNPAACREARRNRLCAVRGDAFNLPLADATADVVVNVEFAQQYGPEAVGCLLHEAARVLRPAGRLVIVWSNRAALLHRIASVILYILNRLRSRKSIALIGHAPVEIQTEGERAGLTLEGMIAIFPPLRLQLRRIDGPLVSLIGSSFTAVFRKRAESCQSNGTAPD